MSRPVDSVAVILLDKLLLERVLEKRLRYGAWSLCLESFEEHLPTSIAGVPSATLGTGFSTPRHKPIAMRWIHAALRSG